MANIFIVEDEKDIRELVAFTLRYGGHSVKQFANGEEVFTALADEIPDLFILDVRMPGVSGYELCESIKQNVKTASIPVIFLSAKGQSEEISRGFDAGAIDYILKPFIPEQLNNKVNQILSIDEQS
ncbi:MAG: hypothetical protein BGO78_03555 [Chloroflexi bacterium 44-23]|nr:MAG: hypothetical protein BGO78_03555 [Chloroflexi bacterium 44-23]